MSEDFKNYELFAIKFPFDFRVEQTPVPDWDLIESLSWISQLDFLND